MTNNNVNNLDDDSIEMRILGYIGSKILNRGIHYYYERPWNNFFHRNTMFLMAETFIFFSLILIIRNLHFFNIIIDNQLAIHYTKLLYDLYCYLTLLHTVLMSYFWSQSCNYVIKPYIVNIYHGLITISLITGFRNYIYQHQIIDLCLLIAFLIGLYQKNKLLIIAYKAIYSNLTPIMKKYLFFYLFTIIFNLLIYSFM